LYRATAVRLIMPFIAVSVCLFIYLFNRSSTVEFKELQRSFVAEESNPKFRDLIGLLCLVRYTSGKTYFCYVEMLLIIRNYEQSIAFLTVEKN
jgi:hypothetical protein